MLTGEPLAHKDVKAAHTEGLRKHHKCKLLKICFMEKMTSPGSNDTWSGKEIMESQHD